MMSQRPRKKSLGQRVKDHLFFSVVSMTAIFVILSLMGIKARFASLVLSILITLALNVGLTYYYEYKARRAEQAFLDGTARPTEQNRDLDIRWRQ